MTKPPQTEEDERDNLRQELGWLTGRAMQIAGRVPHVIAVRMPLNVNTMSAFELADLCAAVRREFPVLCGQYEQTLRRPSDGG